MSDNPKSGASSFMPAEVFPPGVIIRGELDARGWTQADLAEVMERPLKTVNEIIGAKKRVTEETAKELEAALGIDAAFWLNTEALYRLRHGEPAPSAIAKRAAIRRRVPLRQMIGRGWLVATRDVDELQSRVEAFLGSALHDHAPFAKAAKQTTYDKDLSPEQEVWLLRCKMLAETMVIPPYSRAKLLDVVGELSKCRSDPNDARHVPRLLETAGVRFVVVERLPGLGIDGVCFWLSPSKPVIGMSLRLDRIDNFWFVLRHEIEHVLRNDAMTGAIVDDDLGDRDDPEDVTERERAANAAAAEFCVPVSDIQSFIVRKGPIFTDLNIRQFASSIGVHPGLVAGQLRKRLSQGPLGAEAWKRYTSQLEKIRHVVTNTALVDGFGSSPHVG